MEMQNNYNNSTLTNKYSKLNDNYKVDLNSKYYHYIKPILLLLEKTEQILSILNLPDSIITKYNSLKEISFSKCGLAFMPLKIVNNLKQREFEKININFIDNLKEITKIKNRFIDNILNCIENFKLAQDIKKKENDFSISCQKLKEQLSKINDKYLFENSDYVKYFNSEKENLFNNITRSEENMIRILSENSKKINELDKYLISIDEMISPLMEQYKSELENNKNNITNDNHNLKIITKITFLLKFMNQLFSDNKSLFEKIDNLENEKNEFLEVIENTPFIENSLKKSSLLTKLNELICQNKNNLNNYKSKESDSIIQEGKKLIEDIKNITKSDIKENSVNENQNKCLDKLMNGLQNILETINKTETMETISNTEKTLSFQIPKSSRQNSQIIKTENIPIYKKKSKIFQYNYENRSATNKRSVNNIFVNPIKQIKIVSPKVKHSIRNIEDNKLTVDELNMPEKKNEDLRESQNFEDLKNKAIEDFKLKISEEDVIMKNYIIDK